jgi:SNF2 family DNA or RNA helicase
MQRIQLRKEPRLEAKQKAFPFQVEAFLAIRDLPYAAVFHEQGLGKSKIAIDLMHYWLEKRLVDTVLFIVKKGLIHNWEKEFSFHSYIKPRVLTQDRRVNYFVFNSPIRLLLTHYEVLRSELDRLALFLRTRSVAVVMDESTRIKNPNSSLTKAAFTLAPSFARRVIMTGTPVANRPYDLWAQIWFLDQGKSLGNDFLSFKRSSDLVNDLSDDPARQERLASFLDGVYACIDKFTVRETKEAAEITLPEKVIERVECDWETSQYELYCRIQSEMRAVVLKEGIPTEDNSEDLLKRMLRLVQVASNPRLIDEGYRRDPGKLERVRDLVSEIVGLGQKCIIWSAFTENVDWLAQELKLYGTCKIHGRLDIERRNRSVDAFMSDPQTNVLLATPSAAKEGLTLTVANHAIFYDRSFSLDDYLQAQDRIHRISQEQKCYVHNLIMRDSIDEWVELLLESKRLAAQLVQDDISLEHYKRHMSYEFGTMIREILGIRQK